MKKKILTVLLLCLLLTVTLLLLGSCKNSGNMPLLPDGSDNSANTGAIPEETTGGTTGNSGGDQTGGDQTGGDQTGDDQPGGLKYELNKDGKSYSVVGIGTCTDKDVVIPDIYNNLPVTAIKNYAFYMCESLTSVTIPDSITSIGERSVLPVQRANKHHHPGQCHEHWEICFLLLQEPDKCRHPRWYHKH